MKLRFLLLLALCVTSAQAVAQVDLERKGERLELTTDTDSRGQKDGSGSRRAVRTPDLCLLSDDHWLIAYTELSDHDPAQAAWSRVVLHESKDRGKNWTARIVDEQVRTSKDFLGHWVRVRISNLGNGRLALTSVAVAGKDQCYWWISSDHGQKWSPPAAMKLAEAMGGVTIEVAPTPAVNDKAKPPVRVKPAVKPLPGKSKPTPAAPEPVRFSAISRVMKLPTGKLAVFADVPQPEGHLVTTRSLLFTGSEAAGWTRASKTLSADSSGAAAPEPAPYFHTDEKGKKLMGCRHADGRSLALLHWEYEAPDAKLSGRNWVLGGTDQPNLFSISDKHIITVWRSENAKIYLMVSDADGIGSITGFERSGWYTIDKVENVKQLNHIDAGGVAVLSDGSVVVAYAIDFAGIDDLKHFKKQLRLAVFEPGVIRLPKR